MPKINVTGQYWIDKNSKTEIVNFEFKNKKIPPCKVDEIGCFFESRYFPQWLKKDNTSYFGSKPVIANYQIEMVSENEHAPSCFEKNIMEMSWEELQDLATECGLIDIPVIGQSGMNLEKARQKSSFVYLRDVLNVEDFQGYPYSVWVKEQKNPDTDMLENPFDDPEVQVFVTMTHRISNKKNKVLGILQKVNQTRDQEYGDITDLSTSAKGSKNKVASLEEVIE